MQRVSFPLKDAESESLLSPVADGAEFYPDPSPRSVTDERLQVQLMEKAVQTIKRENPSRISVIWCFPTVSPWQHADLKLLE